MSFNSITNTRNLSELSMDKEGVEELLQSIVNNLTRGLEMVSIKSLEFDKIEDLFKDSATLEETLQNINTMVEKFIDRVETNRLSDRFKESIGNRSTRSKKLDSEFSSSNYENLEKMLQKYEAEIREHIRVEQQLKIYSESLEEKVDELRAKLESGKKAEDSAKVAAKKQKELDKLKNEVKLLERKLFKYKKKENCKSVCLDRLKNKSIDHVG